MGSPNISYCPGVSDLVAFYPATLTFPHSRHKFSLSEAIQEFSAVSSVHPLEIRVGVFAGPTTEVSVLTAVLGI